MTVLLLILIIIQYTIKIHFRLIGVASIMNTIKWVVFINRSFASASLSRIGGTLEKSFITSLEEKEGKLKTSQYVRVRHSEGKLS